VFDDQQKLEVLMTLGQSLVGLLFLVNMELAWWEAAALFTLWGIQFALSPIPPGPGALGYIATHIHGWVTAGYFIWFALGMVSFAFGRRKLLAFVLFAAMWRKHVWASGK
jgi:hypothetical protein